MGITPPSGKKAGKAPQRGLPSSSYSPSRTPHSSVSKTSTEGQLPAGGAGNSRTIRTTPPRIGTPPKTTTPKPRPKAPFVLAGVAAYALTAYGTYIYFSVKNIPQHTPQKDEQIDKSHVYENIARKYDNEIWASEFFMGMPLLRRSLGKRATGDVLEVSAGTGRNCGYYRLKKCSSVTMVDTSASMLEEARKKFKEQHPKYKNMNFIIQDAAEPIESLPTGKEYDTVIQSMGLCSHHSPVELLRNLGKVCKKDGGKIILLEHGRSHYEWINNILDSLAPKHAETWGCWWNRDIESILTESGLVVDKISRYHFGTTYWIEARPADSSSQPKMLRSKATTVDS